MKKSSPPRNILDFKTWRLALKSHYTAPLEKSFKQFRTGVILFGVGLAIIFVANTNVEPSAKQEIYILLGLILTGSGFIIAMLAQIRMLISRIVIFFEKK